MTQLSRNVVVDLWPLYAAGEASADTRTLIEDFLEHDPAFGERLRSADAGVTPGAIDLPPDHERATLLRTQRRRARQSMLVNSLALFASAAMTAFYAWDVVPRWAHTFAAAGVPLPQGMRVAAGASAWIVRLGLPLLVLMTPLVLIFRKRLRVPAVLQSGTVVAVVTGLAVVLAQLGWLSLLHEASLALEVAYRALQSTRP